MIMQAFVKIFVSVVHSQLLTFPILIFSFETKEQIHGNFAGMISPFRKYNSFQAQENSH